MGAVLDHNLKIRSFEDVEDIVVKFDPEHFAYDFHPSRRSDARGEGSADGAPTTDIEGKARSAKVDIGAYSYREN
jgi:hypothetical protein